MATMMPRPKGTCCAVVGCDGIFHTPRPRFFRFPRVDQEQRLLWTQVIEAHNRTGLQVTDESIICSQHFVTGKWSAVSTEVDYAPTLFPSAPSPPPPSRKRPLVAEPSQTTNIISPAAKRVKAEPPAVITLSTPEGRAEAAKLLFTKDNLSEIDSNTFKELTGVTQESFQSFSRGTISKMRRDGNNNKMSAAKRLLLVFVKIKLGLTIAALSKIVKLEEATARTIFSETLEVLHEFSRQLIYWQTRDHIRTQMEPELKRKYPTIRAVVKVVEVTSDKPADRRQQLMFGAAKGGFNVKFVIALSPSTGQIMFVSDTFAGRTNNMQVIQKSGLSNLLQPDESIVKSEAGSDTFLVFGPVKSKAVFGRAFQDRMVTDPTESTMSNLRELEAMKHVSACTFPFFEKLSVVASLVNNLSLN